MRAFPPERGLMIREQVHGLLPRGAVFLGQVDERHRSLHGSAHLVRYYGLLVRRSETRSGHLLDLFAALDRAGERR